jgi:peroxiredoxin
MSLASARLICIVSLTQTDCHESIEPMERDYLGLPPDLPVPADDGAARHLPGRAMPAITLARTDGGEADLAGLGDGRTVLYLYPMTGRPGTALPTGWDEIPGARGCTPESCGFRDHYAELQAAGAARVFGMSSQSTDYQREAAERLGLPFPVLSDERLALAGALDLPTFTVDGMRLYRRLTMIVTGGVIEHVFYPVFPPDQHAFEVLEWLRLHPVTTPASGG